MHLYLKQLVRFLEQPPFPEVRERSGAAGAWPRPKVRADLPLLISSGRRLCPGAAAEACGRGASTRLGVRRADAGLALLLTLRNPGVSHLICGASLTSASKQDELRSHWGSVRSGRGDAEQGPSGRMPGMTQCRVISLRFRVRPPRCPLLRTRPGRCYRHVRALFSRTLLA